MKKAITIYVDDCVESIEEVNATFVLHKPTGATSVHMINLNWKDKNKMYLPWKGDAVLMKEVDTGDVGGIRHEMDQIGKRSITFDGVTLYPCDPEKNTPCSKTGCFINGGECRRTTHKEYREEHHGSD